MNKKLAHSFLVVLAVCSCQVKEIDEIVSKPIPESKVFTATIENETSGDTDTKTSLNSSGNVLWKQGDQISIFAGSTINEQYQVTDASDGKTSASLYQVTSPGFVAGTDIDNNVAFYPYSATTSIAKSGSGYVISDLALPATQVYAEASFGNGAMPMTAVTASTTDMNLKFKNVLGGLKLQLKGTATIASISITGKNDEILCGSAEVTVANGSAPSISLTDASAKTVTLDCGTGVTLNTETATAFIIALPPMTMSGGFTVIVRDTEGKQMEISTTKSQTINRSILLKMPAVNYEGIAVAPSSGYVDLGLSVNWATMNIGATTPEEYGDYFAWGETSPKDNYSWENYEWCNGDYNKLTKYNTNNSYGTVDNKMLLDPEDDAAHVKLGGKWRMPTDAEWTELRTNCTWTWTTNYNGTGVKGRIVTATNGNSIFLPAAGFRYFTYLDNAGSYGNYWSSSLTTGYPFDAWYVFFYSGDVFGSYYNRSNGRSVRPVLSPAVESVSINKASLSLHVGETEQLTTTILPLEAASLLVSWVSSNSSVATVSEDGIVTAVSAGTATIIASVGSKQTSCTVTVTALPEAVDLGLSVKWSSMNLGATSPTGYGDYFAWGETSPKDNYRWGNYEWCNGSYNTLTKYNTNNSYGTVDNKMLLDPEDDAAHVKLGGNWRMPTEAEWTELRENCTWTWVTNYNGTGINGRLVTSNTNGNSIFLPAAGNRKDTNLNVAGSYGLFWSSSLNAGSPFNAWHVGFDSVKVYRSNCYRYYGQSVRPVLSPAVESVSINKASLSLHVGETEQLTTTILPLEAAGLLVSWSSLSNSIATVTTEGVVSAVSEGTATIIASVGSKQTSCTVTVTTVPEAVDLGLSVKWRSMNLGATSPTGYGDYFAWGETSPKDNYSWGNYEWCNGSYKTLTKYNIYNSYGTVDNKMLLDPEDDAAHVKLGGNWRMPTDAEWMELMDNCTWTWVENYNGSGINGRLVTSNTNGNSIFLPAAGDRIGTGLGSAGLYGPYWSSSLDSSYPDYALCVSFGSAREIRNIIYRCYGLSVRPVLSPIAESITLNKSSLLLNEWETEQLTTTILPLEAAGLIVSWVSSNTLVATVSDNGLVTALREGTATIIASSGSKQTSCTVTVTTVPKAVDLGLSVKWSSMNLGATSPTGYGDYFAWGETSPKDNYSWENYEWCNGSYDTLTKYNTNNSYGTVDNKMLLDPEDDVASVKLGGKWRMPTDAEWTELRENCTWTWTTQNGVKGYRVTGRKTGYTDKSIFLPAAGCRLSTSLLCAGSYGDYWSSSLNMSYPYYAWFVDFYSGSVDGLSSYRCNGYSVRPVSE